MRWFANEARTLAATCDDELDEREIRLHDGRKRMSATLAVFVTAVFYKLSNQRVQDLDCQDWPSRFVFIGGGGDVGISMIMYGVSFGWHGHVVNLADKYKMWTHAVCTTG